MVGIELFGQKVAPWLIVLSIFAVNFRQCFIPPRWPAHRRLADRAEGLGFFLLTDPQFAVTEREGRARRAVSFAWYFGLGAPI